MLRNSLSQRHCEAKSEIFDGSECTLVPHEFLAPSEDAVNIGDLGQAKHGALRTPYLFRICQTIRNSPTHLIGMDV